MGLIMRNDVPYGQGSEIPQGGTKGQVLAKASDIDGDMEWKDEEGGGGGGVTPTFDAVLQKGNETSRSARFTGTDLQTEISDTGTYMTGIGTEGMRQFSIGQNGISAVDNLVGTITPKFVVPFEPSGEDQVAMSDAVKESFKKALGIANDTFIFDVDSDQFTEDADNPDGKHYGMTITSPTYDELLAMLQTDTFVYARLLYNSGKAYEIMRLFHNNNSIYGRCFDVEFPQKRLQFASAYVSKRNNDTYFGTYQDYITVGGSSIVPFADKTVTEDTFFGDEGYVGMSLNCSGSWDKTADMSQIGTGATIHSYDDRYLYGTISFSTGYTFTAQSDGALLRFVRVALNVGAKYGSPPGWQNMLNAKFKQHYPGDGGSEYTQSRTYPAGQGAIYITITPNGGTAEYFAVPSWIDASVLRRPNDNSDALIDELVLVAYVNRVFNTGDKIRVLGSSDSIIKIRRDMIDFADGYGPYA